MPISLFSNGTVELTNEKLATGVVLLDESGNQLSVGGSGGTSSTDDGSFTAGASSGTPIMGFVTSDSVDAGDVGVVGMLANRQLKTTLYDSSGVEITSFGGGTEYTDDTSTHATGTSKGGLLMAAATPTDASVNANDIGALAMTTDRKLHVAVMDALPAGTNAIGKLAANSGVDIGDVDVTSSALPTGASTSAKQDTQITHLATLAGAVGGTEMQVDVLTMPSTAVTNAGTFAVQVDGNALTSLQLIDDIVYTDDTSTHATGTSKGALIMAAATPTDSAVNANDIGAVGMTTDRKLHVAVMDALPAGTAAIGKLAANSGVDIGDVDITSVIAGTGATNLGKAEDAGHSSGDTGVFVLGVRTDTPNAARADTDLDYAPFAVDRMGGVRTALYEGDFAVLGTNHVKKYYTNAGAVTDGIIWSPAAGKRWYVTDIFLQVSAAATVTLEDDKAGGDEVVWKAELAANSGWAQSFTTPLFSGEDAADLMVTTSAGNIYCTVVGYEI